MRILDVLVLGKGPAGLAAAAALAERGLAAAVLGPDGPVQWPARYGAWEDDLAPIGFGDVAERTWPRAAIDLGDGDRRVFDRPYVRIHNGRLATRLSDACERGQVQWLDGLAADVRHGAALSTVRIRGGGEVRARIVVDASGHRPALVRTTTRPAQGFQTAFGVVVETGGLDLPADQAMLMDWSDDWLPPHERAATPPTFLYALPLGDGRVFFEETVLVGRPALPFDVLENRLRRRLAARGIPVGRVLEEERCWIPMGGPLPDLRQRTVGFGGAAGMVHPATGYLLGRVLERAPSLADAIAAGLGSAGADPARTAGAAWQALWPEDRRYRRDLFCFGMEVLLRLDPAENRAFFAEFFQLPPEDWQGYFGDRLAAPRLRAVMARLFLLLPPHLRRTLAGTALGRPGSTSRTRCSGSSAPEPVTPVQTAQFTGRPPPPRAAASAAPPRPTCNPCFAAAIVQCLSRKSARFRLCTGAAVPLREKGSLCPKLFR